jgi:hypothetical protein
MKLNCTSSIAWTAGVAAMLALASGCGSNPSPKAPVPSDAAARADHVTGTTSLMSAQIPTTAPKVGKAHLAVEDELVTPSAGGDSDAPKEARRSDCSRRGGGFGVSSK